MTERRKKSRSLNRFTCDHLCVQNFLVCAIKVYLLLSAYYQAREWASDKSDLRRWFGEAVLQSQAQDSYPASIMASCERKR